MKLENFQRKMSAKLKSCLNCWCEESEKEKVQFLLEEGFEMYGVVPIMKYDINGKQKHYEIPVEIEIQTFQYT